MKYRSIIIVIVILLVFQIAKAQNYSVGHQSISIFDNTRNRNIPVEIYFPTDSVGNIISLANFPYIIFGHGFMMNYDAYEPYWMNLVPKGYVICFPTTETGLNTDHNEFGLDLRLVAKQVYQLNLDSNSFLFNSLLPRCAIMGHSMGGGASLLAFDSDTLIKTIVTLAAAETNPSAIQAAKSITIPTLIFSGEEDCVAPPVDHQNHMYDSLSSTCKAQIHINGGGHCYFADDNFACSLGETACNPNLSITRAEQQDVTFDFIDSWLRATLLDNSNSMDVFNDSLQLSNRINYRKSCAPINVNSVNRIPDIKLYPNPASSTLHIEGLVKNEHCRITIYNSLGDLVLTSTVNNDMTKINIIDIPSGSYIIVYESDSQYKADTFVIINSDK